jgi:hypothetical protein
VRRTTVATIWLLAIGLAACTDLREFRGQFHGQRVGASPVLAVGVGSNAAATLVIDALDPNGLHGELTVDGLVADAAVSSLAGAEADALSALTFTGAPLRVYLAFVDASDGGGEALAVVALFEDHHVEVRLLRGGNQPIYAIFSLTEDPDGAP